LTCRFQPQHTQIKLILFVTSPEGDFHRVEAD
jgi:hypothetical protein